MNQSKESQAYTNCAVCAQSFDELRPPLIFCRNAHLCCEDCLKVKADGYDYASFLCPLCLGLACKATAVRCSWLPSLLARLHSLKKQVTQERIQLLRDIHGLREELQCSRSNQAMLRRRLEDLERRKHKFSQNWKKALEGVLAKKSGDANWSIQELHSFEKCPEKLIGELDRLCEENRRLQSSIEKLKRENSQLATRVSGFKSEKQSLQLNWSGTYSKPVVDFPCRNVRPAKPFREEESTASCETSKEPRPSKIDGYFTSNLMQIFKEKIRNSQQMNLDKRTESKNKTYKKYLNMKIEELDEGYIEVNPKFNRINSNLKKLRDVFDGIPLKRRDRPT